MDNQYSNLKVRINALLEPNPHEHERYLACCALLIKSPPSLICDIVEQDSNFLGFVLKLIHQCRGECHELKRIGLRLLYLCLAYDQRDVNLITTRDWRLIIHLLVDRCEQNIAIEILDVELMQVVALGIEKTKKAGKFVNTFGIHPNDLSIIPNLIVRRFCFLTSSDHSKNDEIDQAVDGNHQSFDDMEMLKVLTKVLDSDPEGNRELTLQELYCENMILLLTSFANAIQSQCYKEMSFTSPLTGDLIENIVDLVLGNKRHLLTLKTPHDMASLLHYSLLLFLSSDLSSNNQQLLVLLKTHVKNISNQNLCTSMQKLIFSGLTSLINSPNKKQDEMHDETLSGLQAIKDTIRPITMNVRASLVETCGIAWMNSFDKINGEGTLGYAGNYCTMVRLVAGELRIVLGRFVDQFLMEKDSDTNPESDRTATTHEAVQICRDCIRIGLHALRQMLDLASEKDDKECAETPEFNTDSILHIRHTLEDFLNACIQFVLEKSYHDLSEGWDECAYECCRYIGAYLSQVDIFDYDFSENDANGENDSTHHSQFTRVDTVTILRALQQAIDICFSFQEDVSYVKAMTLFPCLLSILTCCENVRHSSLVAKYLFQNTVISSTIENILSSIEISSQRDFIFLSDSLEVISWCCLLIMAIIEFQSSRAKVTTKIMDKKSMAKTLSRISLQSFERIKCQYVVDPQNLKEFDEILAQLLGAWRAVTSDCNATDTFNIDDEQNMITIHSYLQSRDVHATCF